MTQLRPGWMIPEEIIMKILILILFLEILAVPFLSLLFFEDLF